MLTGIHILLTLKCTKECDHCFLHCGPGREATFTIGQLRTLISQIKELETVNIVYFEGGEPFLFYPLLLESLGMVQAAGFDAGIVTNGYWATSVEVGVQWLRPIRDLGVLDFSISDDEFHRLTRMTGGRNSPAKPRSSLAFRQARSALSHRVCPLRLPRADEGNQLLEAVSFSRAARRKSSRLGSQCARVRNSQRVLTRTCSAPSESMWTPAAMCTCAKG